MSSLLRDININLGAHWRRQSPLIGRPESEVAERRASQDNSAPENVNKSVQFDWR